MFAQVNITTPKLRQNRGRVELRLHVSANQPLSKMIRTSYTNPTKGKLLDGIRVVAEDDIAVFVNNPSNNATGVTSILSTASLGTHYTFPSIPRTFDGQVSICIGNLDKENRVWVTLPQTSNGAPVSLEFKNTWYGPGQKFKVELQSYEFADIRDVASNGDLTGAVITSDWPVAVFSAAVFHMTNIRTIRPGPPQDDKDIIIENIPPQKSWGKTFVVTASPSTTPGDFIKVLAGDSDVTIWFSTLNVCSLRKAGDFCVLDVPPNRSFTITANKPVEVVQYRSSFTDDSAPFMFLVPPVESYGKEFTVPIIFNKQYVIGSQNYIVLITHVCHADRVTIRHSYTPQQKTYASKLSSWQPVADGTYVTSHVKVEVGYVTIAVEPSDDPVEDEMAVVGGFFFGQGPHKAYAAPLGLHMTPGKKVFQFSLPDDRQRNAKGKEPVIDGHSKLVARDKLPLTFPLDAREMTSRVACHHECWTMPNCLYVAYSKARNADSSDCRLFGPTAQCSGLKDSPGFLLYKLSK
ncbi:hypothetical protein BaRGS_00036380 [Batillaria attramentaria]|uniref:IgGFc-binding protein N-terminal domain-containing protein n=1 Tax=Batillaria attramentaria TaxID=370345 RepID=A0ABD0JC62_9CAEN